VSEVGPDVITVPGLCGHDEEYAKRARHPNQNESARLLAVGRCYPAFVEERGHRLNEGHPVLATLAPTERRRLERE